MDDAELQAIRAARMQEMQRNAQGGSTGGMNGSTSGSNGTSSSTSNNNVNDAIMTRILEHDAKERLNRVRMVKPERVMGVENYLIRLYQSGGIRGKVSEEDIVEILEKIAAEERRNTSTRIKFERRDYNESNIVKGVNKGGLSNNDEDADEDDDFFDE